MSRCEVDLKKICSEYKDTFGQSLQQAITVSNLLLINCKAFFYHPAVPLSFFFPLYRNIPKETTRRQCSASVDQTSNNSLSISKGFSSLFVLEIWADNCTLQHKHRSIAVKKEKKLNLKLCYLWLLYQIINTFSFLDCWLCFLLA